MRITNAHFQSVFLANTQRAMSEMADLQTRITTGQRILRASDDPIGAVRMQMLMKEDGKLSQFRANIDTLGNRLERAEVYMQGIGHDLSSANQLLLRADGSHTSEDFNAMGSELESLRSSLLRGVNMKDSSGNYLFSGTATDTPAITYDATQPVGSRYSFTGNEDRYLVAVSEGDNVPGNVSLKEMEALLNTLEIAAEEMTTVGVDPGDGTVQQIISHALVASETAMRVVAAKTAQTGGIRSMLANLTDTHAAVQVAVGEAALDVGQTDMYDAQSKFLNYSAALQASQKTYARIMELSIFNVI